LELRRFDDLHQGSANLNINNAFDTEVPFVNRSGGTPNIIGFQINSTLGRVANIGLRKRF